AGVGQLEHAAVGAHPGREAVAGDAGGRIDDGDAPAGEPVEQRRLADVGPADDRDHRYSHGQAPSRALATTPPLYKPAGRSLASWSTMRGRGGGWGEIRSVPTRHGSERGCVPSWRGVLGSGPRRPGD